MSVARTSFALELNGGIRGVAPNSASRTERKECRWERATQFAWYTPYHPREKFS